MGGSRDGGEVVRGVPECGETQLALSGQSSS